MVGVVKDIKYRSLAETPRPYFYLPMQQAWVPGTGFSCMCGRWGHRSSSYPSCGAK